MTLARAAIVAVGSELLTPSRVDTNSLFVTEQLNELGIDVVFKCAVGDDRVALADVARFALGRIDLLVCTGGLGPTDDDLTRVVIAGVLGRALVEDERITARIRKRFAARGLAMPEINRRQAMIPVGAIVLDNEQGTAPGLWIDEGPRVVVLLPGPPRELQPMMRRLVERELQARSVGMALVRRVIRITGRTESHTEEAVRPLYPEWARAPIPIAATILASLGQIELHLSARARSREEAEDALARASRDACGVLGDDVYSTDGRSLEEVLGERLSSRGLHIAVAESCTGGLVTSRLSDVPGSSRYLTQSVVAYANDAKTSLLGVSPDLIARHGAVSEPVARAMALGIKERAGVDIGVGVTGIAGPGGGTPDKPVGTVAVAVAARDERSRVHGFVGAREMVKFQASQAALDMVRRMLLGESEIHLRADDQ